MITGVLLAAGESKRFGSRKLLHPLRDGMAIGLASAMHLRRAVDRAVAVISPDDDALTDLLLNAGFATVTCKDWEKGMGASLACGVCGSADSEAWIVALADMPFIQSATIVAVANALRGGAPLVVPMYGGLRGHPVGFCNAYYPELVALSGDIGAREILSRDRTKIVTVAADDPGIHRDIDTVGDLIGIS